MEKFTTSIAYRNASATEKRTLISILVPLYNEVNSIEECLQRVLNAPLPPGTDLEVIVVDDGSTDKSAQVVFDIQHQFPQTVHLLRHKQNEGKGAAIQTALRYASGEFCIIQDADLEYCPKDYRNLLAPLYAETADAVFGSRFTAGGKGRVLCSWHTVVNKLFTLLCNGFAGLKLTDMETCYKAFRTSLVRSVPLRSCGFGIEPELTIKLAQRRARIQEVSISYTRRTYKEGKKIRLKDAFTTLCVIIRYGLLQFDID